MKKVKILYAPLGNIGVGGLSTIAYKLGTNVDCEKIRIDYFVTYEIEKNYKEIIEKRNGKVIEANIKKTNNVFKKKEIIIKSFYKTVKQNNYDIIHVHIDNSYNAFLYGIISKIACNSKVVFHSHNASISGKIKNILHTTFKPLLGIVGNEYVTCSQKAANWMFPKYILKNKKIKFIENGIYIDKYLFNEDIRREYRSRLNLNNNFVIGNIGRFEMQKNHEFLINVFNEVHKTNNKAKLILVGEGTLENKIKNKVKELNLDKDVIFLGRRNDVNKLMQAFDLFLFPSLYEGLGIVLIEAQAAGLKCIISDVIPEEVNITEQIQRLSLENHEYKQWTEEILKLDKNYNRKENQEQILKSNFNIKEAALNLQRFYFDIME